MTILYPYLGGGWPDSGGGGGGGDIKDIKGSPLIGVSINNGIAYITSQTFVYEQGVASGTWEIVHNLNKFPSVVLVDSAGTTFSAAVTYNSSNKCTVKMNGATTGKAYLN